jgi:P4 family phage/plasmid primase-like protien
MTAVEVAALRNGSKKQQPLYEWLDSDKAAKPYFDIDEKFKGEIDKKELLKMTKTKVRKARDTINALFDRQCQFAVEHSSGCCSTEGKLDYHTKLSIHIVVQNLLITGNDLKALLVAHSLGDKEEGGLFDLSVYRRGQSKFRLAGFRKAGVKRKSKLLEGELEQFIVSDIEGIAEVWEQPATTPTPTPTPATAATTAAPTARTTNPVVSKLLGCIDAQAYDSYELWLNVGCILKNQGEQYEQAWYQWSSKCVHKFDLGECQRTWKSLTKRADGLQLGSLHYYAREHGADAYFRAFQFEVFASNWNEGDYGLSKIFGELCHTKFKCVDSAKGTCYVYDDRSALWKQRTIESLHNYICENMLPLFHQYIKHFKTSCTSEQDIKDIESITKVAKSLTRSVSIKALYSYVKEHPLIYDEGFRRKLNANKDVLSVKNGVVNLRTGELRERRYDDYLTTHLDVEYNPSAKNEAWEGFISDIFTHSEIENTVGVVQYMQELLGYSITGYTSEQIMVIFWGTGSNGKGVLMEILGSIFKQYYDVVDESIFDKRTLKNNANQASPELAKLFEKRLVYCNEIEEGLEFGKVFKSLVDEGEITARNLHSNSFKFDLQCQFMINCNNLPKFEAMECYARRIIPVPMHNKYKSEEECGEGDKIKDLGLKAKILSNKEGVLRWIVRGAASYLARGKLPVITPDFEKLKRKCVGDNDWTTMFKKTGNSKDFIDTPAIREAIHSTRGIGATSFQINKVLKAAGYEMAKRAGSRGFWGIQFVEKVVELSEMTPDSSDDDEL